MTDITENQPLDIESGISLPFKDLLYCFAIILVMLTTFDLMGNIAYFGIIFGFSYTEADIPVLNLILNLAAQVGVILSFLVLYRLHRIEPEEKTSPEGIHLLTTYALYALNLAFAFFVVVNIDSLLTEVFGLTTESPYEGIEPTLALLENPLFVPLFLAVLVVGASISEELVFRRTLIPMLERRGLGQAWVLVISGVVFSLRHTPADYLSGSLGFAIVHLFGTMSGGLMLGYLYLRTRNILWPILLHALTNGVAAFSQIAITIYNDGAGDSSFFLISGFWLLIAVGFGVLVFSYAAIQFLTKREGLGKPVWLQIISDLKIKSVNLVDIFALTGGFVFFSGGIPFLFDFLETIIESSGIVDQVSLGVLMVTIETVYYSIFLVLLCLFVFKKAQPMIKPIFVPTTISGERRYTSPSVYMGQPAYQETSERFCESCENPIIPNAKFCAYCGVEHPTEDEIVFD
ncbi:MAG: CPBP family glutamic-type intramembrane protease [Candidatus Hodarchaeales archaeon]|jgi:membrane protease YdiL (CAAX protease family)